MPVQHPSDRARAKERIIQGDRTRSILGSDRAVRGEVMGSCILCERELPLQLSHVVPRWASTWMRRESSSGYLVGSYQSLDSVTHLQDLPKHYLMCAACEQHLSAAERYWAALTRGGPSDLASIGVAASAGEGMAVVEGVNRTLLLRAIAGTWFRALHSDAQSFTSTRVPSAGSPARDALRRAVLEDNFHSDAFSLMAIKWMNNAIAGANARSAMFTSTPPAFSAPTVSMLVGGIEWVLFLGSAGSLFEDLGAEADETAGNQVLADGMAWVVLVDDFAQYRNTWASEVAPETEPISGTNGEPCPCGSAINFEDCCSSRWLPASC